MGGGRGHLWKFVEMGKVVDTVDAVRSVVLSTAAGGARQNRSAADSAVPKGLRTFRAAATNFFALQKSSIRWLVPTKKGHPYGCPFLVGGRGWIRTTEARRNRFTVCPLWPLGNSPIWSWRTESNHQPADYKSAALPLSHASM